MYLIRYNWRVGKRPFHEWLVELEEKKETTKVKPWRSYHEDLIKDLKDPKEAAGYLNAVLEEGDYRLLLVALRNVAEAHGGMLALSQKAKLSRPNLYRMLSKTGKPEMHSISKILNSFGLTLFIIPKKTKDPSSFRKAA